MLIWVKLAAFRALEVVYAALGRRVFRTSRCVIPSVRLLSGCLFIALLSLLSSSCVRPSVPPRSGAAPKTSAASSCTIYLSRGDFARQVGFLVAETHGMYRGAGLTVRVVFKDSYADVSAAVSADSTSLGVLPAQDVVHFIAGGAKYKAVDVVMSKSPLLIVTRKIGQTMFLSGLVGRRLLVPKGTFVGPIVRAMLTNAGVSGLPEVVAVDNPAEAFARRAADAAVVDSLTDLPLLASKGVNVVRFFPDEYRVHIFGDVMVANDKLLGTGSGVVANVVNKTRAAWMHAFTDPEDVLATLRVYHRKEIDWQREKSALESVVELILDEDGKIPWVRTGDWQRVIALFPTSEGGGLSPRDVMVDTFVKSGAEAVSQK